MATTRKRAGNSSAGRKTTSKSTVKGKTTIARKVSSAAKTPKRTAAKSVANKKTARKASTAKTSVKKSSARKPAARPVASRKSLAESPKKEASISKGKQAAKVTQLKKRSSPSRQSGKDVAKQKPSRNLSKAAAMTHTAAGTIPTAPRKPDGKPTAASPQKRVLSAQQKKMLATQNLWAALEQKKRRAAQPAAWQSIVHHDHPAPAAPTPGAAGGIDGTIPVDAGNHRRDRSGD